MTDLTHFDADGKALMVDVSEKHETARIAVAGASIRMGAEAFEKIELGSAAKGDVLGVARLAGIMAAKKTADLIPLCHPLPLSKVTIEFRLDPKRLAVDIEATAKVTGRTGVEMEALTAASVSALTIYDMVKAVDKSMVIDNVRLMRKEGGKSGLYIENSEAGSDKVSPPSMIKPASASRFAARAPAQPVPKPAPKPRDFEAGLAANRRQHAQANVSYFRDFMAAKGLRPTTWAQEAGVPVGALYGLLQGRLRTLAPDQLESLARVAGVRVDDLLGGKR